MFPFTPWLALRLQRTALFIAKRPLLALCILLALFGLYERYQHIGWRDYAKRLESASQAAAAAQEALRAQERTKYQEQAHEADTRHAAALADARTSTDAFIRAHRVQPARDRSATISIGQATDAGLPQAMPSEAVVVSGDDVRTCGDLYAYALNAHDWALKITGN